MRESTQDKKRLCSGCRDDYYNRPGNSENGECWSLATAKIVERTSVGYFQNPPYEWNPQTTLSCHSPPGKAWIAEDDCRLTKNGAIDYWKDT